MPKLKPGHISPTDAEDAAINAAIQNDPDTREMTARDLARARVGAALPMGDGKTRITMWVDTDVLDAFKELAGKGGKGYQTLINEVLRYSVSGAASVQEAAGAYGAGNLALTCGAPRPLGTPLSKQDLTSLLNAIVDEDRLRQVMREEFALQREAVVRQIHDELERKVG